MASSAVITILMIIVTTLISTSNAEIRFTEIRSDSRRIIPLDEFGFTHNGRLELNVSNLSFSTTTDDPDLSKVGFIIFKRDLWLSISNILVETPCALDLNNIKQVYNLSSLAKGATSFNLSYIQSHAYQYAFVFVNCLPRQVRVRVRVSIDVRSAMYNLHEKSNTRDYLSVGMTILPPLYFFLSLIYFTMAIYCIYFLTKKRSNVFGVHYLMLVVVILKALHLLCKAEEKLYIKQTGSANGWDIRFYILSFLNGITFFTLLILVGNGWSVKKPYLYDKQKWFLMVVIPLQVYSNILQVLMDVIPLQICATVGFIMVDQVCFGVVLSKFTHSIVNLEKAAKIGGKEDVNLKNIERYLFMILGYFPLKEVVYLLEALFVFHNMWTAAIVIEIMTLALYVFTVYSFKPEALNSYLHLDNDNDNDTEAAIKRCSKSTYGSI